jgi:hypothetical protein
VTPPKGAFETAAPTLFLVSLVLPLTPVRAWAA